MYIMDIFSQNCLHLYQIESADFTVHSRIQLSMSTIPNKQKTAFIKTTYLFEYKTKNKLLFKKKYIYLCDIKKNYRFRKTDMIVYDSRKFDASLTLKIVMESQHVAIS